MSSLSLAGRISRYYKLTPTRFFTSAAARREKYGGSGVHKFRLGAPNFFPAAAARHASGWRRRRNSAAEGSSVTAESLRAKRDRKSAISLQRGKFDPKFQVEGVALHQTFLHG